MNIQLLRETIEKNSALDPNDDIAQEECWETMTDILSEDINSTVKFFNSECSDEEFFWLSPIFEDVVERTQSKELIDVFRSRLDKVKEESYDQQSFKSEHMRKWVDYAEYVRSINVDIEYAELKLD